MKPTNAEPRPTASSPIVFTNLEKLLQEKPDTARLQALSALARSIERPEPKGEFETSAAYEQRLKTSARSLGAYPPHTQFAIVLPGFGSYDADQGRLSVAVDPSEEGGLSLANDQAPTVTLASRSDPPRSYIGQNAFGVAREVQVTVEHTTVLIPIGKIEGPKGCDFRKGHPSRSGEATLVDTSSLVTWACGLRYTDPDKIESLSAFNIPIATSRARELVTRPIYIAYVVSFDDLPPSLDIFAGPMAMPGTSPTLDNPVEHRVIAETMTARLRRVVVFSGRGPVLLARSFD